MLAHAVCDAVRNDGLVLCAGAVCLMLCGITAWCCVLVLCASCLLSVYVVVCAPCSVVQIYCRFGRARLACLLMYLIC